jgi:hypothetical protein
VAQFESGAKRKRKQFLGRGGPPTLQEKWDMLYLPRQFFFVMFRYISGIQDLPKPVAARRKVWQPLIRLLTVLT